MSPLFSRSGDSPALLIHTHFHEEGRSHLLACGVHEDIVAPPEKLLDPTPQPPDHLRRHRGGQGPGVGVLGGRCDGRRCHGLELWLVEAVAEINLMRGGATERDGSKGQDDERQ